MLTSHVMPALIRKAHEAKRQGLKQLEIWGSGTPRREFLHVDDCADALVYLLDVYSEMEHVNVGSGEDVTILELAKIVATVVGFDGPVVLDTSKPDGAPRKLMDGRKLAALGWKPTKKIEDGVRETYQWFLSEVADD